MMGLAEGHKKCIQNFGEENIHLEHPEGDLRMTL
jgi:hypothetical protein